MKWAALPRQGTARRWPAWWRWLVCAVALSAIAVAVGRLESLSDGVVVETNRQGQTPLTVFRPATGAAAAPAGRQRAADVVPADRAIARLQAHPHGAGRQALDERQGDAFCVRSERPVC